MDLEFSHKADTVPTGGAGIYTDSSTAQDGEHLQVHHESNTALSSPPSPHPAGPKSTWMPQLLDQPPEVLHHIFLHVKPTDLASLSLSCRHLNGMISSDELLWKIHYLERFDRPKDTEAETWRARTSRLIKICKLLESENQDVKAQHISEILTQSMGLIDDIVSTSSKTTKFLKSLLAQGLNINSLLCRSSLFARARPHQWPAAPTEELCQRSAQLHVMAGMNIDSPWPEPQPDSSSRPHLRGGGIFDEGADAFSDDDDENDLEALVQREPILSEDDQLRLRLLNNPTPLRDIHCYARSRVYDLRRYKQCNMWGPFTDDSTGNIDWEKVQSIMIDIAYNHRLYTERRGLIGTDSLGLPDAVRIRFDNMEHIRNVSSSTRSLLQPWEEPFEGIAAGSFVSAELHGKVKPSLHPDIDSLDPYGVTGTWLRIVCFLDYNDLYRFNFERQANIPAEQERDPIATREAFRLIKLQLQATRIEEQEGVDERTGRPLLPIVHFNGTSRSTFMAWDPNANSRIRGSVYMTSKGVIRWTSFSIFHGEERWRSEGVQIGGLKSARGILGNWFDKDYDVHGPAGPTAFWKISDEMVEERRRDGPGVMQIFMAE
ncbi:hypothetical protein H2200_009846 [Cladophialophora chaetospira]|uniref:F-box domain-containing protein n=1 Tax=Cladophialophora chaetospira TaxID=386627 RepID=A0AA38X3B1_9EURO|nr:hypothetical protein H2200_009846 [Cladophialophora chaetospira]